MMLSVKVIFIALLSVALCNVVLTRPSGEESGEYDGNINDLDANEVNGILEGDEELLGAEEDEEDNVEHVLTGHEDSAEDDISVDDDSLDEEASEEDEQDAEVAEASEEDEQDAEEAEGSADEDKVEEEVIEDADEDSDEAADEKDDDVDVEEDEAISQEEDDKEKEILRNWYENVRQYFAGFGK